VTVTQEWATLEDLRLGLRRGAQSVRAQWRVVGVSAVVTAAAFAGLSFALPTLYESRAIVATVNSSQGLAASGAAALAARLGLANLAPGGGNISLPFLVAVAESWHVVDRTGSDLRRWLADSGVAARVDTAKLLGCRFDREPGPVTLCIRKAIVRQVDLETNVAAGTLTLTVRDRNPRLAAAVARTYVRVLQARVGDLRASQARQLRIFLDQQVDTAGSALRRAEDSLGAFYNKNREWRNFSGLEFERERLNRNVQLRNETYVQLRREREEAQREEVRNTPVLLSVAEPFVPLEKAWPKRRILTLVGLLLGGLGAVLWRWYRAPDAHRAAGT